MLAVQPKVVSCTNVNWRRASRLVLLGNAESENNHFRKSPSPPATLTTYPAIYSGASLSETITSQSKSDTFQSARGPVSNEDDGPLLNAGLLICGIIIVALFAWYVVGPEDEAPDQVVEIQHIAVALHRETGVNLYDNLRACRFHTLSLWFIDDYEQEA